MVCIRRLKPAKVDSVLMFSGRGFQVFPSKIIKREVEAGLYNYSMSGLLRE